MANVQYIIKRGVYDNQDYNQDGVIDEYDDFVFKYVDGVEVDRRPLNSKVQNKIQSVIEKDMVASEGLPSSQLQRVVYERSPPQTMANPPPVIIKEETTFAQHVKAGAGDMLGRVAVIGIANILRSLFESEGGRSRLRKKQKRKTLTRTK